MTKRTRPTVLIADDHIVWRRGLRELLQPTFDVVAEADEGNEAIEKAKSCRPDVVVMDIRMRGMNGIAATRRIKDALPATGVVMISAVDQDEQICESIEAGADAYVVKGEPAEIMLQALECVAKGTASLPAAIAEHVVQGTAGTHNASKIPSNGEIALSERELTVLRLLAEGNRQKEIAHELGISRRTVGTYVNSIYTKLGVNNRTKTILYAIEKGVVKV